MTTLDRPAIGSNGTATNGSLGRLLAEANDDLARGMLSPRVLNDSEVHQAELDHIFTHCWVFVGHVSEIPNRGDYVLRYVGEDQFILVRDEQDQIQLLLNNCMHRASPVCRAEKGNSSHFRCPYHGWIYKNSGEWNGAPKRRQTYRTLDASQWGLRKAPHVDTYQGLIFACLDPDAVSLREYLGGMCWYLDVTFGIQEQGMKVFSDAQRWVVPGNWKSGADNFVGDAFHVQSLHRSAEDIGVFPNISSTTDTVHLVAVDGGHGILAHERILPEPWGVMNHPPEVAALFDLDRVDANQRGFLERYFVIGFNIFPNLGMVATIGPTEDGMPVMYTSLRQFQPRGPEHFEMWTWPMVWAAAPAEFNEASHDVAVRYFGAAGLLEQDDTVAWSGGPNAGRSPFARSQMKLNYQLGLDGMSDFEALPDWPGPGFASTTGYGELNQRRFWQHWHDVLAHATEERD